MKNKNIVFIFLLILTIAISCEKDDTSPIGTGNRLKMKVLYWDNEAVTKTIYTYNNNRVDSIKQYSNSFTENSPDRFNSLIRYTYSGDLAVEYEINYMGNMISSSKEKGYEFENGNIIRCGSQLYSYENGVLVEWTNDMGNQSFIYEYENGKLVRITLYYYTESEGALMPQNKYEFTYIDNIVEGRRFFYNRQSEFWVLGDRIDKYYSNDLCIKMDHYDRNMIETITQIDNYSYNEYGDLTQVEIHDFNSDEIYFFYYDYTYDEYDNLIEVETGNKRTTYSYERGESNIDAFELPESPLTYFHSY